MNPDIKKYYIYDYYLQLNLSTVNGNSLKQLLVKSKSKRKELNYLKSPTDAMESTEDKSGEEQKTVYDEEREKKEQRK